MATSRWDDGTQAWYWYDFSQKQAQPTPLFYKRQDLRTRPLAAADSIRAVQIGHTLDQVGCKHTFQIANRQLPKQYQADLSNMAMASGGTWSMGLKMLCSKNWRRFSLPYDLKKMLHVFMRQQARAAILAAGAGRGRLRGSTNRKQQASALGQHILFSGHF